MNFKWLLIPAISLLIAVACSVAQAQPPGQTLFPATPVDIDAQEAGETYSWTGCVWVENSKEKIAELVMGDLHDPIDFFHSTHNNLLHLHWMDHKGNIVFVAAISGREIDFVRAEGGSRWLYYYFHPGYKYRNRGDLYEPKCFHIMQHPATNKNDGVIPTPTPTSTHTPTPTPTPIGETDSASQD